jgi:hypothetical protein
MVSEERRRIPRECRIGNTTWNRLDYHSRTSRFIERHKKVGKRQDLMELTWNS